VVEPISYELITLVKRLSARLHQNIDAQLKPYDLARSQYVMMYHLSITPGLSNTELAEKMMIEPATLSGIVDTLQAKGVIERIESPDDKRRKDITLTKHGLALLKKIPSPGPQVERTLLEGLTDKESKQFKDIGYKMLKNLENQIEKREEEKYAAKN